MGLYFPYGRDHHSQLNSGALTKKKQHLLANTRKKKKKHSYCISIAAEPVMCNVFNKTRLQVLCLTSNAQ